MQKLTKNSVEQAVAIIQTEVSITDPKAEQKKLELTSKLSSVNKTVTIAGEQELAVTACREAKAWLKEVETARVALKKPFAEIVKKIDKLASDYSIPIELLINDVMGKVSAFQESERQRVAREEAARQEAILKAHEDEENARIAAQRAAQAIIDAQAKPVDGKPAEIDESAILEARQLAIDAEEATQTAIATITAPVVEAAHTQGMATREYPEYSITHPETVYKFHPEFFNLVEKKAVIRGVIHKDFKCDGMKVWMATKSNVRL